MTQPDLSLPETDVYDAARRAADGSALLLDVREPDEWARGRSEHATHLPLGELNPDAVPRDRPILAVCRSGKRSGKATAQLAAAGHDVTNVAGGMLAWAAAGLPIIGDGPGPAEIS